MISTLRRLFGCTTATAAVEVAIFMPIFVTLSLGITDLGSVMFARMTVNAAAQAGAAYAVINSCALAAACQTGVNTAMNDATGNPSFCTVNVCTASINTCADGSPKCIIITASYTYAPIFPVTTGIYSQVWTKSMTVSSTTTIRVQ